MPVRTRDRVLIVILMLAALGPFAKAGDIPAVLSLKDQAAVYDGWLSTRLDKLLPELMRREKIDMWLVICEEYNEDPVYLSLAPFTSLSARRLTMLVMFDRGADKGVERFSVNRYGIGRLFPTVWKANQEDQWQALARAIKERDPKRIGIDESDVFAFGDGLSASKKARLVQALGPDYAKRLVGADRLAVGWLERRLPEEIEVYDHICAIAHAVIAEAFSASVITPGVTTVADVEWWIWEKFRSLGQTTWFNPGISVQRPKSSPNQDSPVIHPGDLLHCDIGINYLRLDTDTQQPPTS
jgi:Xaa-Pro aminopeptidase